MNLNEIAELVHHKLSPKPGDESAIDVVEIERACYAEYAWQMLQMAWRNKRDEGEYEIPSYLLAEVEKEVVNDEIDIADLKYFKALPQEMWLHQVGGTNCECNYVKSTSNLVQLLCDDDSLADTDRTYYPVGKKIKFPKGTHAKKINIVYADMGSNVNGYIEIDEAIGALIMERLEQKYLGKVMPEDKTNNSNSST